ncbi:MAG: hypothetical protein WA667_01700 [Candidatus Nitrosopolaris sp.]
MKLANDRLAIEGCCSICKTKLLKANAGVRKKSIKRKQQFEYIKNT